MSCAQGSERAPGSTTRATTNPTARALLARIEAVPAIGALVRSRAELGHDATLLHPSELAVRLPLVSDAAMHVARAGQEGVFVDVRAADAAPISGAIEDRSIAFAETHADVDSLYFAAGDRAEEIRVLKRPVASLLMPYRVELGPALSELRVIENRVYAFDARGVALLRTERAFAVDAKGLRRDLAVVVQREGEHTFSLTYSLDAKGLEAPVVVDPAWTSTASMAASRQHFSATAHTGTYPVMVAGGIDATSAALSSGEVYLPSSNAWIPTSGGMSTGRWYHRGVTLPSNKLLVSGGNSPAGGTLSTTDIYDPTTNNWSAGPSMAVPEVAHTMTVLPTGKVLVNGANAYVYDGIGWTAAGTHSSDRYYAGAVLLKSGKVLVAGGMNGVPFGSYLSSAELYDPGTNSWSATGSLNIARRNFGSLALLPSGDVLIAGGQSPTGFEKTVERYSVSAGTWTTVASMSIVRASHSTTVLSSGRILVAGGSDVGGADPLYSSAEIFNPTTSTWTAAGAMVFQRENQGAVVLPGIDKVMIAGGAGKSSTLATTEVFTPQALGGTCVQSGECTSGFCTDGRCCEKATCGAGSTCNGSATPGTCKKINGQTCTASTECANGQCVDGVCCASSCAGQCQACDVPGSLGACVPVPSGGAPRGARSACPGTGACRATCDGSTTTSCKSFPGAATSCSAASCSDATHAKSASGCDGAGACVTPLVTDCGKYACVTASASCKTSCTSAADCAPGYGCASGACQKGATGSTCTAATECASGFCVEGICCGASACPSSFHCNVPGKLGECSKPNGGKCSTADECGSGQCVDGVCCNSACGGQCEACDVAGSEGTCSAVTGAPRGMRAACVGSGVCGGTCDGVVHDACTFPSAAKSCGEASCTAGVETLAASCDGAGGCAAATTHKCEPFNCGATACKSACAADADCATGKCDLASAKCVSGAQCDGDHTIANIDGTTNDCAPLKCAGSSCLAGCSTSTDCVAGYICDTASSRCVATAADTGSDGGCTTSPGGRSPFTALFVLAGVAVAVSLRRRRQAGA